MKKINVNINDFLKKFGEEYEFLYNARNCVPGYHEAVDFFDELMKTENGRKFVCEFCEYRGDFIASDREAAAFSFTMESFGLL